MSALNLPHIATVNQFSSVEISYRTGEGISPWSATIHGEGIGTHGCTFGYGDTPQEALSACIASAHAHRAARSMVATSADEVEFAA